MGLTEKLRKVLQIKEEIRQAIIEKGVSCTDNIAFEQYPDRIRKISVGTGVSKGIDTSLCFCQMVAVPVIQQTVYCNNGSLSSGAIRHYDGAGTFPLTAAVVYGSRLNILAEE